MKIAFGADSFGIQLMETIQEYLKEKGHDCFEPGGTEIGDCAYYKMAHCVAQQVSHGLCDRGILVCGTGMGMAIIANKHPGVYAAVCEKISTAMNARSINNANVLTLGGMEITPNKAKEIVDAFLSTEFKSGWDADIQSFLDQSMIDIPELESEMFK